MSRRPFTRTLLASAAAAAAIALAGCNPDSIAPSGRAQAPLSDKMLAEFEAKQMDTGSPILMRIFKEEAEAEVWKVNRDGEYVLLKTYPICRWSGDLGPKIKEGDRQAPEGFYTITPGQMNPNSNYYLAFNTGYPNSFDRAWNRTGSELMVHGDCSSRGCYAMTDEQMVEIYALARESFFGGQKSFQLQAYPFRMTAKNLAKHRNSPHLAFWRMLKAGSDHFEVTHQEPKVDVCDRHYVFNAGTPENASRPIAFNPRGKCPVYEVPKEVAAAVHEKEARDHKQYAELVAEGTSVVASRKGVDGGMNPVFLAQLNPPDVTDSGRGLPMVPIMNTPGALPRTSNKPAPQVVPPKQPEQVEVADATPVSFPAANVPVPRNAPLAKEGAAPPEQPTTIAGLLGGLFGGSSAQTAPAAAEPQADEPKAPISKSAAKPKQHAPAPRTAVAAAAPKANERVASAVPQLRSRLSDEPAKAEPAKTESKAKRPELRTAFSATPSSTTGSGTMAGAQPVVPAGTFESRWSALR